MSVFIIVVLLFSTIVFFVLWIGEAHNNASKTTKFVESCRYCNDKALSYLYLRRDFDKIYSENKELIKERKSREEIELEVLRRVSYKTKESV